MPRRFQFRLVNAFPKMPVGRYWMVLPAFAACYVLTLWLSIRLPVSQDQALYPSVLGVVVFFTLPLWSNRLTEFVELRGVGYLLLGIAIGVVAFAGVGISLKIFPSQKMQTVASFSFYAHVAGLLLVGVYCALLAAHAWRNRR